MSITPRELSNLQARPVETTFESLGADVGGVQVHHGGSPAGIGALAYTQGNELHFHPGQNQNSLQGHEAWHVVQQHQGRVQPGGDVGGFARPR